MKEMQADRESLASGRARQTRQHTWLSSAAPFTDEVERVVVAEGDAFTLRLRPTEINPLLFLPVAGEQRRRRVHVERVVRAQHDPGTVSRHRGNV